MMQLSICKSPPLGRRLVLCSSGNDCSHNNNATGSKCQRENWLSDWSGPLKSELIPHCRRQDSRQDLGPDAERLRMTPHGAIQRR